MCFTHTVCSHIGLNGATARFLRTGDPSSPLDGSSRGYAIRHGGALQAGDATWHHGWLLHSAPTNDESAARRAIAISFFADGARRLHGAKRQQDDEDAESCAAWVGDVREGHPARHKFLPIAWPPGDARHSKGSARKGSGRGRASRRKSRQ